MTILKFTVYVCILIQQSCSVASQIIRARIIYEYDKNPSAEIFKNQVELKSNGVVYVRETIPLEGATAILLWIIANMTLFANCERFQMIHAIKKGSNSSIFLGLVWIVGFILSIIGTIFYSIGAYTLDVKFAEMLGTVILISNGYFITMDLIIHSIMIYTVYVKLLINNASIDKNLKYLKIKFSIMFLLVIVLDLAPVFFTMVRYFDMAFSISVIYVLFSFQILDILGREVRKLKIAIVTELPTVEMKTTRSEMQDLVSQDSTK